jgi:hypothetical protein
MIDYEKVDKLVENCKRLYPDLPDYVLWVLACDYYIHEDNEDEDDESKQERERSHSRAQASEQIKKEALEAFFKAQEELKTTKYENIKVV